MWGCKCGTTNGINMWDHNVGSKLGTPKAVTKMWDPKRQQHLCVAAALLSQKLPRSQARPQAPCLLDGRQRTGGVLVIIGK